MATLQEVVDDQVAAGRVPGAVALVASGGGDSPTSSVAVAVSGRRAVGGEPMTRDTVFRIASITKPITAAATMALVERGVVGLDDPVATWLPELAEPVVLRDPAGPLDDVVPAERPITVRHLLTSTCGYGFGADLDTPVAARLLQDLAQGPPRPQEVPPTDEWMARLGRLPLQHQPGEGFLYNASSDILGVLLARARGSTLGAVLADTILDPLGMVDTGFVATDGARLATHHRRSDDGGFAVVDGPDGQWATPPPFESGAGGLVSTADDWLAFGRMLLAGGTGPDGRPVLAPESVRLMTTSHVEGEPDNPFLAGQGWGFGGGVDLRVTDPWTVVGRYGWIGGTGTAGYVIPAHGTVVVWLAQVEMAGPDDFSAVAAVLTWAAQR